MAFRIASKQNLRVVLSLVGESQSGKTFSALRVASGMTGDPTKIFVIDSEGRADMYCDVFGSYNVANVAEYNESKGRKKYDPRGYIDLINEAKDAGAIVTIIDSMSHAWESEGGCLDMADNQTYRSGKPMIGMDKWKMPKLLWKNLIQTILDCGVNVILTFKAQRQIELDADGKPMKEEVLKIIRENKAPFDLTAELLLADNKISEYIKMPKVLEYAFPIGALLTEDTGRDIIQWRQSRNQETIVAEGKSASDKVSWAQSLNKAEKQIARLHWNEIKGEADNVQNRG